MVYFRESHTLIADHDIKIKYETKLQPFLKADIAHAGSRAEFCKRAIALRYCHKPE